MVANVRKLGELVDRSGPELFRFELSRNSQWKVAPFFRQTGAPADDDFLEPPDAPPIYLGHLPTQLAGEILDHGFGPKTWDRLVESEVKSLTWRQRAKHLEPGLVSDQVFESLREIAPGSFFSRATFDVYGGAANTYHLLGTYMFPHADNDESAIDGRPTVIGQSCSPPFEGGYREASAAFRRNKDAVYAFPSWLARDDKVLRIGSNPVVTRGFMERWKATQISQYLRDDNFEHDIQFVPSIGCIPNNDYRWVDRD